MLTLYGLVFFQLAQSSPVFGEPKSEDVRTLEVISGSGQVLTCSKEGLESFDAVTLKKTSFARKHFKDHRGCTMIHHNGESLYVATKRRDLGDYGVSRFKKGGQSLDPTFGTRGFLSTLEGIYGLAHPRGGSSFVLLRETPYMVFMTAFENNGSPIEYFGEIKLGKWFSRLFWSQQSRELMWSFQDGYLSPMVGTPYLPIGKPADGIKPIHFPEGAGGIQGIADSPKDNSFVMVNWTPGDEYEGLPRRANLYKFGLSGKLLYQSQVVGFYPVLGDALRVLPSGEVEVALMNDQVIRVVRLGADLEFLTHQDFDRIDFGANWGREYAPKNVRFVGQDLYLTEGLWLKKEGSLSARDYLVRYPLN